MRSLLCTVAEALAGKSARGKYEHGVIDKSQKTFTAMTNIPGATDISEIF